jgi:SAM-dependent methyltransferase
MKPHLVRQLRIQIDATAGTVMTGFDGDLGALDHLGYDVTNLAHHLRSGARVLVIGVGGGRDVLAALRYQRSVLGVEVNADLLEALNGRFGDFTGHLDRNPRVRFVNDEARSFVGRLDEPVDLIQVSLIDTWAATAAGAFVLTENALYTTEAWKVFLSRLSPTGLLSFSRWYEPGRPAETQRLLALAAEALRESGASDPLAHLALVTNLPHPRERLGVATLIASPSPLSPADLATLRATAEELGFTILLSPEQTSDPRLVALARGDVAGAGSAFDLSPPTDDRPFFFHTLPLGKALRGSLANLGDDNARAVRVLAALLLISLCLTAFFLILPLAIGGQRVPRSAWPWLLYFSAIGFGFMCVEISQMQRLIVFLGHPVYGLTVLLFSLLVSSGIGSALTPRIDCAEAARRQVWRLALLVAVLVAFGLVTPGVIEAFRAEPTPARIAVAVALLAPIGLMLGMAFPVGLGAASLRHAPWTPWFWGLNGAASVCASVVALAIAISQGISAALWAGVASYAVAALALARALRSESPVIRRGADGHRSVDGAERGRTSAVA